MSSIDSIDGYVVRLGFYVGENGHLQNGQLHLSPVRKLDTNSMLCLVLRLQVETEGLPGYSLGVHLGNS